MTPKAVTNLRELCELLVYCDMCTSSVLRGTAHALLGNDAMFLPMQQATTRKESERLNSRLIKRRRRKFKLGLVNKVFSSLFEPATGCF